MSRRVPASLRDGALVAPSPPPPPSPRPPRVPRDLIFTAFVFLATIVISYVVLLRMSVLGPGEPWDASPSERVAFLAGPPPVLADFLAQKDSDAVLLAFYTPTCPHCKRMQAPFLRAAEAWKAVVFVAVDAAKNGAMADEFDVEVVPTLFLIRGGKRVKYDGPPNYEMLSKFLEKEVGLRGRK